MKAKIFNFKAWVVNSDQSFLKSTLNKLLTDCEFNVLGYNEHEFEPYGFTCVWVLGESHLAVHTWPEKGKAYIELSSCNEEKQQNFINKFNGLFTVKHSTCGDF